MKYNISTIKLSLIRDSVPLGNVQNPTDAAEIAQLYIGDADREHLIVLLLDVKHNVTGLHTVSIGHLSAALIHPREVFKAAILGNAAAIIVAHNHPSGNLSPSEADKATTERLVKAGELLDIPVLDHIVVGAATADRFSFRENGLM